MKKVFSNSAPSKLVRRVLSRTSNASTSKEENKNNQAQSNTSKCVKDEQDLATLETELTNLKDQISILQLAVHDMQEDADKREKTLANIAREKQQLYIDLRKEKRSTCNLKQQLQDEREFYYQEKEQYCQEMNDCKKLKKKISENMKSVKKEVVKEESAELVECKGKISRLQEALNQTLETNYNLSVRFMRMKNTKTHFKNQLKQQESEHKQAMQHLQTAVNNIKNDLSDVVDKRFMLPISPSNKKYLQVIKQNGMLMYENLCLQVKVDRLNDEKKLHKCREPKRNLKQTQSSPQQNVPKQDDKNSTLTKHQTVPDLESKNKTKFENETQKSQISLKPTKSKSKPASVTNQEMQNTSNLEGHESNTKIITIFERSPKSLIESQSSEVTDDYFRNVTQRKSESKCVNLANIPSETSTTTTQNFKTASQMSGHAVRIESNTLTSASSSRVTLRTQSAPEIVQSSLFVSKRKP